MTRLIAGAARRRDEQGHTLVEMLVATGLLSIVLASAFGVLAVMQHQQMSTTDRFVAQAEGQTITDRITKDLRTAISPSSTAAPFVSADVKDVTFYANLSDPNGPSKLHAYTSIIPGTAVSVFHEDSTKASDGGSPGNYAYGQYSTVNRLDGRYIDTSQPMFTYYDADGNQLATPITDLPTLRSIESVGISITIKVRPTAAAVVIQSKVHIRNVDYNPNS